MIPDERFSSVAYRGSLLNPWSRDRKISHHWGPVQIQDPSQGLLVKLWTLRAVGGSAVLSAPGSTTVTLFTRSVDIDNVNLAFDQNGRPCVCFEEEGGGAYLYWFDPVPNEPTFMVISGDAVSPRITLDDARAFNGANSDVILAYVRAGIIRYRRQRDRFQDEYTPLIGVGGSPAPATGLSHVSMNSNLRLEFLTEDGGGNEPWTLADVVVDLLGRSDIPPQHIDERNLYRHTVEGYRIANQGGADSNIAPLTQAWFFDPGEWDKKLRFVPRGGEPVAHLSFDDLLEREDSPFQIERVQEVELLRKVNVTMVDSTAGWIANKQTAERRSATIKAVGEQSTIMPITAHPDFTATVATKRLRIPWGEPYKFKFALGTPWSALTPTDIVTMTDKRGRKHTIRLGQIGEDYGRFEFESTNNAGWVYKQTATGAASPSWNPTVPGQIGDTTLIVLDIPVLYDQDDELGYYVAVYGEGEGWRGAQAQMRVAAAGGGQRSWEISASSTVGKVATALLPERDGEYLSNQKFHVQMLDGQLASSTRAGLLNGANLAAVQRADGSWELLQFQTVVNLGSGLYELSGLVRGRYATDPEAVAEDGWFVLIDGGVSFVQVQRSMVGQPLQYRAISYGSNADDVDWNEIVMSNMMSQDEWPAHMLRATRDGGNVTVTWIDRGRLGNGLVPYHSKYFDGFQVAYSDGPVIRVAQGTNSHSRSGVPANVTITVSPLNRATMIVGRGRSITV